jgi:hypothetical protein
MDRRDADPPRIRAQYKHHAFATWRHLFVTVVRGRVRELFVDDLWAGLHDLARTHAGGIGFIFVAEAGCGMPKNPVRGMVSAMMRDLAPSFLAVAGVIEGSGMRPAAMRSALALAARMGPPQFPICTFATAQAAAAWQAARLDGAKRLELTESSILSLIERTRDRIDAPVQRPFDER